MIKKINILLIVVAIVGSLYIIFTNDDKLVYILKDISIIFTINALYLIQKIFKIKISDEINFIYILFIFVAHFLGVTCELYNKIYWFDKFVHFLSGVVSALGSILVLIKFKKFDNTIFSILCIIAFSLMVASLWEMFEFTSSCLFNVDPQLVNKTGVTDTMGNIIVAFLGSILVSLCYYFETNNKCNLLVTKFIKNI